MAELGKAQVPGEDLEREKIGDESAGRTSLAYGANPKEEGRIDMPDYGAGDDPAIAPAAGRLGKTALIGTFWWEL